MDRACGCTAGPPSLSESEEKGPFRRKRRGRGVGGRSATRSAALSLKLNVDGAMDPDLTPLDDDSSSVDTASALDHGHHDDHDDDAEIGDGPNRWHLPLTDDDAIVSNVDEMSVRSVDEMSVSLHRESKKRRVDSGSTSLSTLKAAAGGKAEGQGQGQGAQPMAVPMETMTPRQSVEEKEGGGDCLECAARKSEIGHLRGVHVAGLGMAKLMALESELLTALQRVQRAMAQQYENEKLCIVCKRLQRDCVFRPCSHISTCTHCAKMLSKCPLCQTAIDDKFKVFL